MNSLKILIIFVGALSIFSKILNINSDFFIPSASAYLKNASKIPLLNMDYVISANFLIYK